MNTERSLVTLALLAFCGLGFLSSVSPIVNLVMTIAVVAAFVIGAVIVTVHLVRLNRAPVEPAAKSELVEGRR
jgi:hypothetical protein